MWDKTRAALVAAALAAAAQLPVGAAELGTLFTTPQERQIVNRNRYKGNEQPVETAAQPETEKPVQVLAREEVTRQYRISGISISPDGSHTVWVNSRSYIDGEKLDDGSRVNVETSGEIRVRFTAPDGSRHFGLSGETVEFTYLAPIESR